MQGLAKSYGSNLYTIAFPVCGNVHNAEALRLKMTEEDVFDVVAVLEAHIAVFQKELSFLSSMMA